MDKDALTYINYGKEAFDEYYKNGKIVPPLSAGSDEYYALVLHNMRHGEAWVKGWKQTFEDVAAFNIIAGAVMGAAPGAGGAKTPKGDSGTDKWTNPDGSVKWPPNNGAVKGTEEIVTMKPGTEIGRIGKGSGQYVAPPGTTPATLSLKPGTDISMYNEYRILKEIPGVEKATVAPWFDQLGHL